MSHWPVNLLVLEPGRSLALDHTGNVHIATEQEPRQAGESFGNGT